MLDLIIYKCIDNDCFIIVKYFIIFIFIVEIIYRNIKNNKYCIHINIIVLIFCIDICYYLFYY
jgi:hypothetical protein